MPTLTIKGDLKKIERALKQEPRIARRSAVAAINKTTAIARTAGVRELSRSKKLPQRIVKSRTKIRKANDRRLYSLLVALTAGVPIDRAKYRELKKGGISAGGRKFPHAFAIGKNKRGIRAGLVFERKTIDGARVGRLPIERVKIPLNPEAARIFNRVVRESVQRELPRIFANEMRFRLSKRA